MAIWLGSPRSEDLTPRQAVVAHVLVWVGLIVAVFGGWLLSAVSALLRVP